jgi:epoxyqueuosine reductase
MDFVPRHALDGAKLVELFAWTEVQFLERTEGSAIRRIGYECWVRNIAVALGNAPTTPDVINALLARRDDPSALVREHVEWALAQHQVTAATLP